MAENSQLIEEYKISLKHLEKQYKAITSKKVKYIEKKGDKQAVVTTDNRTSHDIADQKTIAGMINDCKYSLFWLENGYEMKPQMNVLTKQAKKKREQLWGDVDNALVYYDCYNSIEGLQSLEQIDGITTEEKRYKRAVESILADFSDREKELFYLKYSGMLSDSECAQVLGISSGTVKSMSQRIRDKIEAFFSLPD